MEGFDLFFFLIIFIIVSILSAPHIFPQFQKPFNCSQFNNNFQSCVTAQQAGKGCAWYADCNTCYEEKNGTANVCSGKSN
jgi:hypothetical protein